MANSVPTLTNENYHMFEPSPLETSLAARVGDPTNPQAFPLMMSARFRNETSGQNYQSQVDQMHAAQIAEAMMAQRTQRMGAASTALKDAGATPGMAPVLQQMGLVDPGIDLSGIDNNASANAAATRMGNAGRGIGSAAMGGITGLAPAAASVFGPGVDQGPAAIVQAAQVKEAGANARSGGGGGVSMRVDGDGNTSFATKMRPGETPDAVLNRIGGGAPPPTFAQRAAAQRSGGGGMTSLPRAQVDDGSSGIANNPLLGPIPQSMSTPAATSNDTAKAQVVAAVQKQLPAIQKANPAAYADIHATGAINVAPYRGGWGVKGASGTVYPLGGAQ